MACFTSTSSIQHEANEGNVSRIRHDCDAANVSANGECQVPQLTRCDQTQKFGILHEFQLPDLDISWRHANAIGNRKLVP